MGHGHYRTSHEGRQSVLCSSAGRLQSADHRLVDRLSTGLHAGRQCARHGHPQPASPARWDRPRRSRSPVHLLGLRRQDPLRRTPSLVRQRRRRTRQRDDGILLVIDADRALEPQEMEDSPRARERDLRLHRDIPQPATTTLIARLSHPNRIRTILGEELHPRLKLTTERGNQTVGQVKVSTKLWAVPFNRFR